MNKQTILLVEDETDVMLANQEYLVDKGFDIICAANISEAKSALHATSVDLILLDVNLPDGSGFEFMADVKDTYNIPIIFLTCRSEKHDMIDGLVNGACDYITKPYDFEVLHARIISQLNQKLNAPPLKLSFANIEIDILAGRAFINGKDLMLKPKELTLLLFFQQNAGKILSGNEIYKSVWGTVSAGDIRTVRVHVHSLRKKLSMHSNTEFLVTMPNEGYCFISGED